MLDSKPGNGCLSGDSQISMSVELKDGFSVQSAFDRQSNIIIDNSILNELKSVLSDDYLLIIEAFYSDADGIVDSFKAMEEEGVADYKAISQLSHSLKSTSQNVGAVALSSMAAQLESESRKGDVSKLKVKLGELIDMYQAVKTKLQTITEKS